MACKMILVAFIPRMWKKLLKMSESTILSTSHWGKRFLCVRRVSERERESGKWHVKFNCFAKENCSMFSTILNVNQFNSIACTGSRIANGKLFFRMIFIANKTIQTNLMWAHHEVLHEFKNYYVVYSATLLLAVDPDGMTYN